MIISDLNYLEVSTEAASITGGGKKKKNKSLDVAIKADPAVDVKTKLDLNALKAQVNVGVITQVAAPVGVAIALKGDAVVDINAENSANIGQNNDGR